MFARYHALFDFHSFTLLSVLFFDRSNFQSYQKIHWFFLAVLRGCVKHLILYVNQGQFVFNFFNLKTSKDVVDLLRSFSGLNYFVWIIVFSSLDVYI